MCGIFGMVHRTRPVDVAVAERANRLLRHRGPDDEGYLLADWRSRSVSCFAGPDSDPALSLPQLRAAGTCEHSVVLTHRRLSILDLSPAGHQPMSSCDGRLWITFNGEIYNYLELRAELASRGYAFRTGTDTEVILAAYDAWGSAALDRFVGMFAFAVLDLAAKTLFLARDFFGIKPLYYAVTPGGLAFASEIPPLLEVPGVGRRANPRRVYDYLRFGYTDHGAETMFADVRQLPAGHHLTVDLAGSGAIPSPTRYWDLRPNGPQPTSFEQAAEHLRELFLENVRLHLRSDVPVGACLSGGVDSSAIVAAMRQVGGPALDLHTFSYLAADPVLDEERWANIAGAAASSVMHKVRASPAELAADVDRLVLAQGEPFGGTSIYAQDRVFRLAHANGMKVMLDGQGADELFLGYPSFFGIRVGSLLRRGNVLSAIRFARRAASAGPSFRSIMLLAGGRQTPEWLQPVLMRLVGQPAEPSWFNRPWFRRNGVPLAQPGWPTGRDLLREEAKRALLETSLPGLLRYEDRNSMAYSIESRVPFVTPQLASFVFSLPDEYLLSGAAVTKAVLRKSLRGLVPDPILDRRDKIGFATPQARWLAELRPHIEAVLCSQQLERVPALDHHSVRAAIGDYLGGNAVRATRLWTWYNLVRWAECFGVEFAD